MTAQEAAKRVELSERRALLADRVRNAYDTDRTSPLETFLSGGSFTDMLAEMSYYIDVGEQDKALADQIAKDQETLAALHQTVADTRDRTNAAPPGDGRAEARARQERCCDLKETQGRAQQLETAVAKALREQKARYAALVRNKAQCRRRSSARPPPSRAGSPARSTTSSPSRSRRATSRRKFNGTMRWPMDDFTISGEYGCSSFAYYAAGQRLRALPQRHRPRRAVRHADQGRRRRARRLRRLELGRRRGPGLDRRHRPRRQPQDVVRPHAAASDPVAVGQSVKKGQVDRLRGQHRPRDRRRTSTGWSSSTATS